MPSAIVETAGKGEVINAPVGADVRNAASIRTALQPVGNRLKFLENFYDLVKAWSLGGTITPSGDVTIGTRVLRGDAGGLGRIRTRKSTIGANADQSYDPAVVNLILASGLTGARIYTLVDTNSQNDDEVIVCNISNFAVSVVLPAGAPIGSTTINATSDPELPKWTRVVRIAGLWRVVQRHV